MDNVHEKFHNFQAAMEQSNPGALLALVAALLTQNGGTATVPIENLCRGRGGVLHLACDQNGNLTVAWTDVPEAVVSVLPDVSRTIQ